MLVLGGGGFLYKVAHDRRMEISAKLDAVNAKVDGFDDCIHRIESVVQTGNANVMRFISEMDLRQTKALAAIEKQVPSRSEMVANIADLRIEFRRDIDRIDRERGRA